MTPDILFWPLCIGSLALFVTGIYCILATFNLIRVLIGLELLMKAVTLFIITVGNETGNIVLAQSLVITLIVIEVVVITVAMGIVFGLRRHNGSLDTRHLRNLKG